MRDLNWATYIPGDGIGSYDDPVTVVTDNADHLYVMCKARSELYFPIWVDPPAYNQGAHGNNPNNSDIADGSITRLTRSLVEVLGLEEYFNENKKLLVYPNPTTGLVNFYVEGDYTNLSIYNTLGTCLYSCIGNPNLNLNSIDLSTYECGVYFITITSGKSTLTGKIIVVH